MTKNCPTYHPPFIVIRLQWQNGIHLSEIK